MAQSVLPSVAGEPQMPKSSKSSRSAARAERISRFERYRKNRSPRVIDIESRASGPRRDPCGGLADHLSRGGKAFRVSRPLRLTPSTLPELDLAPFVPAGQGADWKRPIRLPTPGIGPSSCCGRVGDRWPVEVFREVFAWVRVLIRVPGQDDRSPSCSIGRCCAGGAIGPRDAEPRRAIFSIL